MFKTSSVLWLLGILSSMQSEGTAVVLQNPVDSNQNLEGLHTTNGSGTDCSLISQATQSGLCSVV